MSIGYKYTETRKNEAKKANNWTKEEKAEYVSKVKKWRSELKRYQDFNVYYHPDLPTKPYRKKYDNGYFKMVPWKIFKDKISVGKDGEIYKIKIADLEAHNNGFDSYGNGSWTPKEIKPTTFQAEIPVALKDSFNMWLEKNVESPF